MKGVFSLIKWGTTRCYGGFGHYMGRCRKEGTYDNSSGHLHFEPRKMHFWGIINELDILLTGGRLSSSARSIIRGAMWGTQIEQNLRKAQQLVVASPDFHSSGLFNRDNKKTGDGDDSAVPREAAKPYKAIVYVFMNGGADTFNLLIPHSGCGEKDLYAEYTMTRGNVALDRQLLHPINATNQPCTQFGIHPNVPFLQQLYQEGDASFFANTGVLYEPSTKNNYLSNHIRTRLFDHHSQKKVAQEVRTNKDQFDTGVLGRLIDVVSSDYLTGSTSTNSDVTTVLNCNPESPPVSQLSELFVPTRFDQRPSFPGMRSRINSLNNATF